MAQDDNGRPNPPQSRANFAAPRQAGNQQNPAPTAPPPPDQTGRGAAPGAQQANPPGSSKQEARESNSRTFYFRSSQASTNIYMQGKDTIHFRNNMFQTDDPEVAEYLRKEYGRNRPGTPLLIEEVNEGDFKQARQEAENAPFAEMGIRRTNEDGVSIVDPVVTPIPGQNMMVYPQPPVDKPVPTPGPHIAPEVSMDPADKGGVRRVVNPVTTQANPGAPEQSTLRPQDHPNVPAEMKEEPDIEPAPRPAGADVTPPEQK